MDPEPSTPTTEHDHGVPAWPKFRYLYAAWASAADWQTRGQLFRLVATRKGRRLLEQLRRP